MPRFMTISPTHIPGMKESAWERFRDGGYVAIGWMHVDLTGKTIDQITELIHSHAYPNETSAINAFTKFLSLHSGDYVAVNNANHGLFGVGVIQSGYRFQLHKHATGAESPDEFYSHYREVKWLNTSYTPRKALLSEDETGWQPYGTVGKIYPEVPPYISRLLGIIPKHEEGSIAHIRPKDLETVIHGIEALRKEADHKERAHESLVEDLLHALGYQKHRDIKYRQGHVDITLQSDGRSVAIIEVKASWDLSRYNDRDAIRQGYGYAHDNGVRYVIVTNGDTYILFDRLKGLSWDTNVLGEFRLTSLQEEDLSLIDRLRPARMATPDIAEALRHVAESFAGHRPKVG